MNSVILIGRLVKDPELRFIPTTGTASNKNGLGSRQGLFKGQKARSN
jgi:single-stranded DNA-binding protein